MNRKRILAAAAATALLGGAGWAAAAAWPGFGGWYRPQEGYANARPAVAGRLVFAGTGDGRVIARDRATGAERWTARVGDGRVEGAELVARAGVVVAPVLFHTVGLDAATGAELWRYRAPPDTVDGGRPLPGTVQAVHPDADRTTAYLPAWGGTVAAVELRGGRVRWTWRPPAGLPHRFGAQGARVSGDTVFATLWHFLDAGGQACEGWVVAIDARSGRTLWRTVLPARSAAVCVPGAPALAPGRVVASTLTGEVFGVDRATGRVVWNVPREEAAPGAVFNAVITSPAAAGGVVYADAGTGALRAVAADDGRLLWRAAYPGQLKDDLLVTRTRIYGADGSDLYVWDRRTGARLGVLAQPNASPTRSLFSATPAAAGGGVFAPVNGGIWAFPEGQDSTPRAAARP